MEFFASLPGQLSASELQAALSIASLPDLCGSIDSVLRCEGDQGRVYCVWGEFDVVRTPIQGGVRFTLLNCINSVTWSLTTDLPPDPDTIVIHLSINRREQDADFVESLEQFAQDWREGLERWQRT
ncbi:MAG: hypothetical protein OQL11_12755 [Gammaproteobacteria bacterium]|nr:hypothetical protein [Gammaproteobacteria bacterium]